jgi:hypothetical protein
MGQKSNRSRYHRVHAAVYRMAVRKGQLTKRAQMCIVTGPRIELAITLISRLKGLFTEKQFI